MTVSAPYAKIWHVPACVPKVPACTPNAPCFAVICFFVSVFESEIFIMLKLAIWEGMRNLL